MQSSGLKVGLFTSPHLFSFCERIVINGVQIPEETVRQGLLKFFELNHNLCFFDLATLLAFQYFRDQQVDIAVIEAGIGGLFDTTNIILPLVSVITSVAKDHEEILGKTLEEIAFQKAGIIKPGVPIVIGPQADFKVIQKELLLAKAISIRLNPKRSSMTMKIARLQERPWRSFNSKKKTLKLGLNAGLLADSSRSAERF